MAQIAGRAGRHQRDGTFGTLAGGQARRRARVHRRRGLRDRGAPLRAADQAVLARGRAALRQPRHADRRSRGAARAPSARARARGDRPRGAQAAGRGCRRRRTASRRRARCGASGKPASCPTSASRAPTSTRASSRGCGRTCATAISAPTTSPRGSPSSTTPQGDIDTLQGRIAAIRSWAYICQRPDWVLARDEMAARARAVEARLSDALHAAADRALRQPPDRGADADAGEGCRRCCRWRSTRTAWCRSRTSRSASSRASASWSIARASHEDRKLLLAAAEKHLPQLLALKRARRWSRDELGELRDRARRGALREGRTVARLERGKSRARPRLVLAQASSALLDPAHKARAASKRSSAGSTASSPPLAPLRALEAAARDPAAGSEVRALLLTLVAGHGVVAARAGGDRASAQGEAPVAAPARRDDRRARRVRARAAQARAAAAAARDRRSTGAPLEPAMPPVIAGSRHLPAGYRRAGSQAIRVDLAEKLFRAAHERARAGAERRGASRSIRRWRPRWGCCPTTVRLLCARRASASSDARALAEGALRPARARAVGWRPPRKDRQPDAPGQPRAAPRAAPSPRSPSWCAERRDADRPAAVASCASPRRRTPGAALDRRRAICAATARGSCAQDQAVAVGRCAHPAAAAARCW